MANDPAQALAAAEEAGQVDDGFDTPEERAAFADMEKTTSDPAPAPEPVPAPAPAPAAAADAGDDDEDDEGDAPAPAGGEKPAAGAAPAAGEAGAAAPPPKRRVSAKKFERAEAARIAAEKTLADERVSAARLAERLNILNEVLTPKAPDPAKAAADEDPEPDAEKDVFAWVKWSQRERVRMNERLEAIQSGRQTETEDTQLANDYIADARTFAATQPNFVPAYQFLMDNRTVELAQYFYGIDLTDVQKDADGKVIDPLKPDQWAKIRTTIGAEEKQLTSEALKNKQSPAKRIFALAKARGFRPQAPAAPPKAGEEPGKTNGAAAPAAAGVVAAPAAPGSLAKPAAPSVVDEIARIREGSEASRSLSTGGGAPPSPLTPEKLANMSQEEFGALVDSLSPAQQRELMGD